MDSDECQDMIVAADDEDSDTENEVVFYLRLMYSEVNDPL